MNTRQLKRLGLWGLSIVGVITVGVMLGCDSGAIAPLGDLAESPFYKSDEVAAAPGAPGGSHLAFNFNLIGRPNEYDGDCGNGHRIFVERDAHHAHIIIRDHDDGWHIEDCNGTGNNRAELHTDGAGIYDLYVRILGKPGGELSICADTLEDHESGEGLCYLGTVDLTRGSGKSRFSVVPDSMFDASGEDLIWDVDTNRDFRIAQFRVYRRD